MIKTKIVGRKIMEKIICFHNPDEINGYLSNWYLSDFFVNGILYYSMEQYMMYQKALLFDDMEIAGQILNTTNAGKIKAFGRRVKNYEDILWNGMRQLIVYQGLLELAECAVQDKIWGIGLSMKDERRFDLNEWKGQNLLGFSLMRVRTMLKQKNIH